MIPPNHVDGPSIPSFPSFPKTEGPSIISEIVIPINPCPKPRMSRRDVWKHRPIIDKYYAYKDELNLRCNAAGFKLGECIQIIADIQMPKTWSKKKKATMIGQPHQSRPDADNITKAIKDCLTVDDSYVWWEMCVKFWAEEGRLIIRNISTPKERNFYDSFNS